MFKVSFCTFLLLFCEKLSYQFPFTISCRLKRLLSPYTIIYTCKCTLNDKDHFVFSYNVYV